jgi:glycosyltransferase involved in cell wall biosynthesis/GT2 family glycosyltransferase
MQRIQDAATVSRPAVSVAICAYNSMRYIDETVDSVFAQTFQDFEIVVIDDGSSDGTADHLERSRRDSRLRVVRQPNQTLRVARPAAAAHARGEFIAFLDHDDVWLPRKLERQIEAAGRAPDAALVFSDCLLVDSAGRPTGSLSEQFDFAAIDLAAARAHLELLRRGNFVAYSTAMVRASVFRDAGGFNHSFQYVSDYDLWLRLARRHRLLCVPEPLAKYRVHGTQFTQQRAHLTLAEHVELLLPVARSHAYPPDVRIAVRDMLFGQHRVAFVRLWRQRRYREAARAGLGLHRYPGAVRDYCRGRLAATAIGPAVERGVRAWHWCRRHAQHAAAVLANGVRRNGLRARRAPRRLARILRGQEPLFRKAPAAEPTRARHVWVDGSVLGRDQAGYFSLLSELVRQVSQRGHFVHVMTTRRGRDALAARLGADASALRFHSIGWRAAHWSHVHAVLFGWHAQLLVALIGSLLTGLGITRGGLVPLGVGLVLLAVPVVTCLDELRAALGEAAGAPARRLTRRVVRYLWRRFPAPRRRAPRPDDLEILFWRGRFRWCNAHRVAIIQDMTTRIHPELHTAGNTEEFEEFLGYTQRHAHTIATVSEHSRRDIVDRIAVAPDRVSVIPMPVHPQYARPSFNPGWLALHAIAAPYVLCVGTIEPRKNLRRLVKAFELLKEEPAARGLTLVLVGAEGWDDTFSRFLTESDAYRRVRRLGFVPLEHLPSLYHYASAVICASVYEGFGIPVLEAMCSSGLVLASRVSSLPDVAGPDTIQFDPFDTCAIAAALLAALSLGPSEAAHYRRRGRERAERHLERVAQADYLAASVEDRPGARVSIHA